ncbi:hypothetical protein N473_08180 [Pseudoalteromonas luteoviolacea CPMOR-1]|uniref:AAA+ ATPase domain-containing protein n=1 Tax=Pseudoalteromonas luteoviolacea CPMOR-1 TaxID=1365248 RepID=A0A162BRK3_9GAMM|nr:ATP-binding protein [Pseudoalteromonas luteoviolacea]KZN67189.1 hypothetical protein N473_08180 [Pseudoalteromonas luteoviolacea CPMOR-1]
MWQPASKDAIPSPSDAILNAHDLERECRWLDNVIQYRVSHYFGAAKDPELRVSEAPELLPMPAPPSLQTSDSPFATFLTANHATVTERLLIMLALAPIVRPTVFDVFLSINEQTNRPFTEFGMREQQGAVLATGATAAFIEDENQLVTQFKVLEKLKRSALLSQILDMDTESSAQSSLHTPLVLKPEFVQMFTTAEPYHPETSSHFPASLVDTQLDWRDLKLPDSTREQLNDIIEGIRYGQALRTDWKIGRQLRAGYRALFYGPPGTGKTLTASVLGKVLDKAVYKVDLSLITSKYIGETEKNLEQLFSLAEHRDWVLFFDEADALFGKRLQTSSSNDQFANQNVAYLLQRIEQFDGTVILASNYKDNIDDAFFRRFESIVEFQPPQSAQRLEIWQSGLCGQSQLSSEVCLTRLSDEYPLSGAEIINVLRFVSLRLLAQNRSEIQLCDIREGIARLSDHRTQLRW